MCVLTLKFKICIVIYTFMCLHYSEALIMNGYREHVACLNEISQFKYTCMIDTLYGRRE